MIAQYKLVGLFMLGVLLSCSAYADHYNGHYDDQYDRSGYSRGYHQDNRQGGYGYSEEYGYRAQSVNPQNQYRQVAADYGYPNYGSSDGYYACPNGDYISDRPGRCPLDGMNLVPRSGGGDGGRPPVYRKPQYY